MTLNGTADRAGLEAFWRELSGREIPTGVSQSLIRRFLATEVQNRQLGGPPREARAQLAKPDHHFDRRSNSAIAKYADALRRISFAWRSSRFSRSSAFMRSAISLETPGRLPLSTSAFLTQSFRVCGAQPIFAEIDMTACHRDPC
jgi:hypothetical protein